MSFRDKLKNRQVEESGEETPMNDATMELLETMIGQKVKRKPDAPALPPNALVPADGGGMMFKGFRLSSVGLLDGDSATFEEWRELGDLLFGFEKSIQWLIGDWLNIGEKQYGQTYDALADSTGYKIKSLYEYAYVARQVEISIRMETLSFGHHGLVAGMKADQQRKWLMLADSNGWSVAKLREEINGGKKTESVSKLAQHFQRDAKYIMDVLKNPDRVNVDDARKRAERLRDLLNDLLEQLDG